MAAVSDLATLLATMDPALLADRYVFCTVPPDQEAAVVTASPFATVREAEGLSAVLPQAKADAVGLPYDSVHRCITLRVYSSLTAVGLTAAVATALAEAGLSANVVAGHHHDHVFVPADAAERAVRVLRGLAERG